MTTPRIDRQRDIIARRAIAERIAAIAGRDSGGPAGSARRPEVLAILQDALEDGRAELRRRLLERPGAGHESAHAHAFLIDQLVRLVHDHVVTHVYPAHNRSAGERLVLLALGGYGRGEMSPASDVDLAFVTPDRPTSWCEQVIEAILYFLWDLGLKVGHSVRSVNDAIRLSKTDLTIRTALLEARFVWGDQNVYDDLAARFWADIATGTAREFIAGKLEERDARHRRMGDSRYVVEPNVKDGKGGLRDLQTLYWIGKYVYRVRSARELIEKGLFTQTEYRSFRRAEGFLLAVRAHLHTIAGRAEDRLTFDLQREVATRMNYADRPGKSAVERFMQFYFLQAKHVGHLTAVFLAHLEEENAERSRVGTFLSGLRPVRQVQGYPLVTGMLAAPSDGWFRQDPVRLLEIYAVAEEEGLDIHPGTSRTIRRDAALIDKAMRHSPKANALFMQVLCGRSDPESVLRWMNETGVFGRFVPDFGKVGGQMQFDMYHHYTVDEHTIRAVGLLSQIERGRLRESHPLASEMLPQIANRRALYVAVLLHDIAKGRGGDHSVLGARVAQRLCPRLGMDAKETALVAWLVRMHLLMSATAFKRDLSDSKTVEDFLAEVQNLERLRLLAILTVVDIRAVGPGVWNSWKRQLIADLYEASVERLRLGHKSHGRDRLIAAKKERVAALLEEEASLLDSLADAFDDAYWVAEPEDVIAINLPHYAAAQESGQALSIHTQAYGGLGATLVTVIADDHPGLFYRIAGAISLCGANIIDARIHTNRAGKAIDNFIVQDPMGGPFAEAGQLERLETQIRDALAGKIDLVPRLAERPLKQNRADSFTVAPMVLFDNSASSRFTVLEVNAIDMPALLNRLTRTLFEEKVVVHSAHITHYGERAVDTFYVTDLTGQKLEREDRLSDLERALLQAIAAGEAELQAA